MTDATYEFYARCASGFEPLLAQELKDLGIWKVRPLKGGVAFFASLDQMYRACLWLRTASRILLILQRIDASNASALYDAVSEIKWETHIGPGKTMAVYAHGVNDQLRNTQFTAMKTKDAICDRLRRIRGERPNVDGKNPDVEIDVAVHFEKATIAINVSGQPLHRRGYRIDGVQTEAPLKETLAASIVLFSGWKEILQQGGTFADPMCGSGTLAIEAAMIAADMAPGITRAEWGFLGWTKHDDELWNAALDEADERMEAGMQNMPRIIAGDIDPVAIEKAQMNAKRAGLSGAIEFYVGDAAVLSDRMKNIQAVSLTGLVVTNPPYGQRLLEANQLPEVYESLAKGVEDLGDGWTLSVITPDDSIDTALGLIPAETIALFNGSIEAMLRKYALQPGARLKLSVVTLSGKEIDVAVSEENSEQFAGRLRKMAVQRTRWAHKNGISCYRVYDADLNDYAVAVDIYEGVGESKGKVFARVTEYQAPETVDQQRAQRRFNDAIALTGAILELGPDQVFSKQRRHDKGGGQYRDARGDSCVFYTGESGYEFEVDMDGYLDTGIFLDHRITRCLIGKMAKDKVFLNLFAYTGTATVHAAGGGAASTTTVDMSQTYLNWASRNMEHNGFRANGKNHKYFREDATEWVFKEAQGSRRYDLIFCDPPTFSNSKSMGERTWSIQRDHVRFLQALGRLLNEDGRIVFSCNLRNFKLDREELEKCGFAIKDISSETIPEDFERNPKIHHCFVLALPHGNDLLPTFDDVEDRSSYRKGDFHRSFKGSGDRSFRRDSKGRCDGFKKNDNCSFGEGRKKTFEKRGEGSFRNRDDRPKGKWKDDSSSRREGRSLEKHDDHFRGKRDGRSFDRKDKKLFEKRGDRSFDKQEGRSYGRRNDHSFGKRDDRSFDKRKGRSFDKGYGKSFEKRDGRSFDRDAKRFDSKQNDRSFEKSGNDRKGGFESRNGAYKGKGAPYKGKDNGFKKRGNGSFNKGGGSHNGGGKHSYRARG